VYLRYKNVRDGEVVELKKEAPVRGMANFHDASPRLRLSATVAAFADILRDSYWSKRIKLAEVREVADSLLVLDTAEDSRISELVALMEQADGLLKLRVMNDYARLFEEVKRNRYQQHRIQSISMHAKQQGQAWQRELRELREQNRKVEERIMKLLERP
ncbi:MAG: YfbK domain-containing protein, partial [Planctomycetota bacterium]